MGCSCDDQVKSEELFREECRELINNIQMYRHHLDDEWKIPCYSCGSGKFMREFIVHKNTGRR